MSSRRALAPLLVLLLLTACSDPGPTPDPVDSGVPTTDAGSDSPLAVTTESLPDAYAGREYSATLSASGGVAPLSWSVTSGSLPAGLSLSSGGVLSGTPSALGTSTFTVTVQDADGDTDTQELSLAVRDPGSPVLTVGQWNITYFGSSSQGPANSSSDGGTSDDLQIAYTRDVIRDAGVNLWGLVEMVDSADFEALKAQLPGYSGFISNNATFISGGVSPYGNSNQKLGVLYDSALTFQSAQLILKDRATELFASRPPLRVDFTTEIQGVETPLVVIVVHMKANTAQAAQDRDTRERAGAALKAYLDENLPTQHVFVLGDWNDDVDDSISLDGAGTPLATPYQDYVTDSERYTFITRELSLAGEDSTVEFENMVDHTLASNEAAAYYVAGSARVLRPEWVPDYLNTLSDHYPVVSAYAFSQETGPFVRLKQPNGGTYQAGSALNITWTSWAVSDVRIEVSTNDGAEWDVLAASVPAVQGSYTWTLPDIDSSSVRVRVVDTSNPARADVSEPALALVRGAARVFINEVLATPAQGDAYEFVELVNASPFTVDLSGWSVWDSSNSSARYTFGSGARLAPGKALAVFGGAAGIPAGLTNAVAASTNLLGLSGSDTVRLRQPDSVFADEWTYTSATSNVSFNRSPDASPDGTFVLHNTLPSGSNSSPGRRADGTEF